jgi:hypothetical protein
MTDTDKAVADYLAMTNDLLIAMATQLETLRKGIGVLQVAQGVMACRLASPSGLARPMTHSWPVASSAASRSLPASSLLPLPGPCPRARCPSYS